MILLKNLKYILFFNSAAILRNFAGVIRAKIISVSYGAAGLGILGQVTTIYTSQTQLSDLGLFAFLVRSIVKSNADGCKISYQRILVYSATILLLGNLIIVVFGFCFLETLSLLFFDSTEFTSFIGFLIVLVPLFNYATYLETVTRANENYRSLAIGQNIAGFTGVVTVAPLVLIYGIIGVIYSLMMVQFVTAIYFTISSSKYFTGIRLSEIQIDRGILKDLSTYCSIVLARKILVFFSLLMLRIVVVQFGDVAMNGYFQAVYSVSNYVLIFVGAFIIYLFPALSGGFHQAEFNATLNQHLEYLYYLILPVICLPIFLPDLALLLLFNEEFLVVQFPLMLFSLSKVLEVTYNFFVIALLAQNRLRTFFAVEAFKAILLIAFSYLGIQNWGLNGVYTGYLLTQFFAFCLLLILLKQEPGFKISRTNMNFIVWTILSVIPLFIFYDSHILLRSGFSMLALIMIFHVIDLKKYEAIFAGLKKPRL